MILNYYYSAIWHIMDLYYDVDCICCKTEDTDTYFHLRCLWLSSAIDRLIYG